MPFIKFFDIFNYWYQGKLQVLIIYEIIENKKTTKGLIAQNYGQR